MLQFKSCGGSIENYLENFGFLAKSKSQGSMTEERNVEFETLVRIVCGLGCVFTAIFLTIQYPMLIPQNLASKT